MAERVRFPGDPEIKETGSGKGPVDNPLGNTVRPTSVEMLTGSDDEEAKATKAKDFRPSAVSKADEDEDEDFGDEAGPAYNREQISARIGTPLAEADETTTVEAQLDNEDVVPMLFPTTVKLQDKGIMHTWAPGVHLVPIMLAGRTPKETHWWLKRNRVRRTQKDPMPRPDKVEA